MQTKWVEIMNYFEAAEYIDNAYKSGISLGLDRMRKLMDHLGNPQDKLKLVHIAGTNGKGSILACTMSMLRAAGYKVGTYSSPQVVNRRDHFMINGEMISEADYASCVFKVSEAVSKMEKEGYSLPTGFEIETAMAFLYYYESGCDIAVIECGLGGRDDATNIIKEPLVCAFASISLDHMSILGSTVEEITKVKAGIIKKGTVVVNCNQEPKIRRVLQSVSDSQVARLVNINSEDIRDIKYEYPSQRFSYKNMDNISLSLAGTYQIRNAATAISVIEELNKKGFLVDDNAIREGLSKVFWPCRFEKISENPLIIIDGAHNEDAALRIKESINTYFKDRYIIAVLGILKDKNYERICEYICGSTDEVICLSTKTFGRELLAEELKNTADKYNEKVYAAESYERAVSMIFNNLSGKKDPLVIVCGSLSYLTEIKEVISKWIEQK